jgi:hypothetical protein
MRKHVKGDVMYEVKRLLVPLAALIIVVSVSLAAASAGGAATVTRTLIPITGTERFFGGNCGFPLTVSFDGNVWMTENDKNDGTVQLVFTPDEPIRMTVTNPANGNSLSSLQASGEVIVISGNSFSDHNGGILWNFHLPGSGAVLQWIGMNNFVTGAFSGKFTSDTTAFCNYLAGS